MIRTVSYTRPNMIPKIIHHTGPTDKSKWNPVWHHCYESWKKTHSEDEYKFMYWDDESIDDLIKSSFPEYSDLYFNYPYHILKIDFAKIAILVKYGGLYADLDMYCYKNFFHLLENEETVLLQAQAHDEFAQDSMFAAAKNSEFFRYCMQYCKENFYPHPERYDYNFYIKDVCGPYQLSRCALLYGQRKNISMLDWNMFNPNLKYYDKNIITKHMLTGSWGKDVIQDIEIMAKNEGISYEEAAKKRFLASRDIDIDNYDFFTNNV